MAKKTYNVGRISVEMIADTVQYVNKLKEAEEKTKYHHGGMRNQYSRTGKAANGAAGKIGGLTNALDKAAKTAQLIQGPLGGVAARITTLSTTVKGFGLVGAGVGVTTAAFTAMTATMTAAAVRQADAQKRLKAYSDIVGVSRQEMWEYGKAVNSVGISMEKFGDINKDVMDKLGDFVSTGGGPFTNFFKNVAPIVGMTADQLQNLSGPEVLQKVKDALDQANVPLEKQVFYLEEIANDASLLIPLLSEMGEGMDNLRKSASKLNTVMSDETLSIWNTLSQNISTLTESFGNFSAEAFAKPAKGVSESVESLSESFSGLTKKAQALNILSDPMFGFENAINGGEAALNEWIKTAELAGRSLDSNIQRSKDFWFYLIPPEFLSWDEENEDLKQIGENLEIAYKRLKKYQDAKKDQDLTKTYTRVDTEPFDFHLELFKKNQEKMAKEAAKFNQKWEAMYKSTVSNVERAEIEKNEKLKLLVEANKRGKLESEEEYQRIRKMIIDRYRDVIRKENIESAEADKRIIQGILSSAKFQTHSGADGVTHTTKQLSGADQQLQTEKQELTAQFQPETQIRSDELAELEALDRAYWTHSLMGEEQYENQKYQIKSKANTKIKQQEMAFAASSATIIQNSTQSMMDSMKAMGKEGSAAYKAMFLVNQAAGIANAIISTEVAAAKAMELGPIAGPALAATVRAAGYMSVGVIAGQTLGQFHSGTDSVPSEGSFLLQKGERVIQPKANQDLTKYLRDNSTGNSGNVEINYAPTISGIMDQKTFAAELSKHSEQIAGQVSKVQRERPTRR